MQARASRPSEGHFVNSSMLDFCHLGRPERFGFLGNPPISAGVFENPARWRVFQDSPPLRLLRKSAKNASSKRAKVELYDRARMRQQTVAGLRTRLSNRRRRQHGRLQPAGVCHRFQPVEARPPRRCLFESLSRASAGLNPRPGQGRRGIAHRPSEHVGHRRPYNPHAASAAIPLPL